MKYITLFFLSIFIFVTLISSPSMPVYGMKNNGNGREKDTSEKEAAEIVGRMNDEEALAQTFMLGWYDTEEGPSPLITEWVRRRHIGAVKVFGWNAGNLRVLAQNVAAFRRYSRAGGGAASELPLIIATDQEGGLVRHVKGDSSRAPGAMAIGASGFPEDAYRSGYYIGRELAVLGINMNFAPAVDLFTNHDSILIGPRSFGDDPVKAGILGEAFARGQLASGIIPTAKHFPGHGDTEKDSHGVLPFISAGFDTLWERELVPYRMLSKAGIPAIMSGHIAFPNTKAGREPASLSNFFLNDVLREKIGFRGVIVTDDLAMNGATSVTGSVSQAVRTALGAGNDIVMISQTPELDAPVWTSAAAAMKNDEEFRKKVRRAAERVVEMKLRYLREDSVRPDLNRVQNELPDREGSAFFQELAARGVTVLNAGTGSLPLTNENAGRVLLAYRNEDFRTIGRMIYPDAPGYWYDPYKVQTELLEMARGADTIIFQLKEPEGINALKAMRGFSRRVIVVSVLTPALLTGEDWINAHIAVYSDSYPSLIAGFSALSGRIEARGIVPFKL